MLSPVAYLGETQRLLAALPADEIANVQHTLKEIHEAGKTLFVCGNGGSASTASHFALDLSKQGVAQPGQRRPRVMALTDNQAAITAWANDTDYSRIFLEQLGVWLQPGDAVLCISGSGNSPNVLRAAEYARERGAVTIGLTGFQGGQLAPLCDQFVNVPSNDMGQIETVHMALCHYFVSSFQHAGRITMADSMILGLDFGGTKQAAGVLMTSGSAEARWLATGRRQLPPGSDQRVALSNMLELAGDVLAQAGHRQVQGVGVSFDGPVDPGGRPIHCFHIPGWDDFPLTETLAAYFNVPAFVENDANAAALAEALFGAGRAAPIVFYITVSTGIGGGLVSGGRLWRGRNGMAGEVGHMILRPGGPACPCGRRGCLESLAAGPAIARRAREALAVCPFDSHLLMTRVGDDLASITAVDVSAAAAAGDALALAVFTAAAEDLGLGVANVVNLLDPDVVVIGGGVSNAGDLLLDPVRRVVSEQSLARGNPPQIVRAALGDQAALWGSAAVALQSAEC